MPIDATARHADAIDADHDRAPRSRAARVLVGAGLLATLVGLVAHDVWRALPAERFALSLLLAALALGLAWPLRRAAGLPTAAGVALAWGLALMVYAGPLPVLAAALLGLAAAGIGLAVVPAHWPSRLALATALGLATIGGLAGWVLAWPVFQPWLWWPLLAALVLWRRGALREALAAALAGAREAVAAAPRAATASALLLGLAGTACWLPVMQFDDLAYHLDLPTQLMLHGRYAPRPEVQMWAYAPWAGDTLHGLAFVLARREAVGAVNALWLLVAAGAAWSIARALGASPRERWASLALFASLPPLAWMAAGMQTELAGTTLLLALAAVLLAPAGDAAADPSAASARGGLPAARALAAGALLGGLFALKIGHGAAALPLLAWGLWRHRAAARPGRALALGAVAFLALGASSYAQAWWATGNPVLPMLNHVFGSPVLPAEPLLDARWRAGLDLALPWRLTFDTDRYVEGWDGGLGFTLVALAGAWLWRLRAPATRGLALAAAAALVLPLLPMQYARYAWPGVALLCVLLPVGLRAPLGPRAFAWAIAAVCTLNLAYQANASWLHHSAAFKRTLRALGDGDRVFPHYVPERLLAREVPDGPDERVLATDPLRSVVAQLAGRGRTVGDHDPRLARAAAAAEADASGAAWAALLREEGIRWVLLTTPRASPALRAGLARAGAGPARTLEDAELWRVPAPEAPTAAAAPEAP